MSDSTMRVNIVTVDHPVWQGEAKSVSIPAYDGEMGILPSHEPVLTLIRPGKLSLIDPSGTTHAFLVDEGFISFDSNHVTVAAEKAEPYTE